MKLRKFNWRECLPKAGGSPEEEGPTNVRGLPKAGIQFNGEWPNNARDLQKLGSSPKGEHLNYAHLSTH